MCSFSYLRRRSADACGAGEQAALAVVGEKWPTALDDLLTGRANDIGIGSASLVFVLALVLALMAEAFR